MTFREFNLHVMYSLEHQYSDRAVLQAEIRQAGQCALRAQGAKDLPPINIQDFTPFKIDVSQGETTAKSIGAVKSSFVGEIDPKFLYERD